MYDLPNSVISDDLASPSFMCWKLYKCNFYIVVQQSTRF